MLDRKGQGMVADALRRRLPPRGGQPLAVIYRRQPFGVCIQVGRQDDGGGGYGAGERAPSGFVNTGDQMIALSVERRLEGEVRH